MYDKEFKTYKQQIKHLKNKYSLKTKSEVLDEYNLKSFPYYNLVNGYKEFFMKNNKYNNTALDDLIKIHILDKDFLNIIFKYSTYVEEIFKHKLAYIISSKSVDEKIYLNNPKLFIPNHSIKVIRKIKRVKKTNDDPTKHYRNNHNHIPAWILFKNVKFSDTTEFYKILNYDIKLQIIKEYEFYSKVKFNFKRKKNN